MPSEFYKENKNDKIWWLKNTDTVGEFIFSFDKQHTYNLFQDYPFKMTDEEVEVFDKENPEWADFFKDRKKA